MCFKCHTDLSNMPLIILKKKYLSAIFIYLLLRNHNQLKRSNLTNRQVWRMPTYLQQPVKCYCQTCADNPLLGAAATFEIWFRVIISTENQERAENSELTYISLHVLVENNLFFHLSSIFCVSSHIGQISKCLFLMYNTAAWTSLS